MRKLFEVSAPFYVTFLYFCDSNNISMKKNRNSILITLTAVVLLVAFGACNNDQKAIRQMCKDIHAQYPKATLQDVYKTCYQDYFGAEHLVRDTASARFYLHQELEEWRNSDMSLMPERELTGFRHRFTRVNLACVVNGELSEDQLLALFLEAASKENAFGDNWAEEWKTIEQIALEVCPDWANPELQSELQEAAQTRHAVRHSDAFRDAYNPHYRIVRN